MTEFSPIAERDDFYPNVAARIGDMFSPQHVIDQHGGIARGVDLTALGFTRHQLARAVNRGVIDRLRPGVFATRRASADIKTAASHGGALTCAGALRHRGVWVLHDDAVPHVWLGRSGRTHAHPHCRCVEHFRAGRMRLGVAPIEKALVHAYDCHGAEFFFCALESAWNQRKISSTARRRIRNQLPRSARWLVDFARDDAQSGLESLVRLRLHMQGIRVRTQVVIDTVGRVDFLIEDRLILESDGELNHGGARNRHKDLRRDASASALGYETLRFDYALIVHNWPLVMRAIEAALDRM